MKANHWAGSCLAAIIALCSISGIAQEKARSLDEVLTQDEGMMLVSEGLYARTTPGSESYVAVGRAGHATMLEKLLQLRAKMPATQAKNGAAASSPLEKAIADLDAMHLNEKQTVLGSCSGPGAPEAPHLRAIANSSGGLSASASAVMTGDFSPPTYTTNSAAAETQNRNGTTTSSQIDTEHAYTQASASATSPGGPQACLASGYASVTCPTGGPGISAFVASYVFAGCML
jgi:hypothetical protein